MFLLALGRLDEALAVARRYAEEVPSPESMKALSQVHRIRGEPAEALQAGRSAVALAASPPGSSLRWAWVDAGALGDLEGLLRGTPEERDPHWLALRGRWREALASFDAARPAATASDGARAWYHTLRADLIASGFGDAAALRRELEAQFREGGTVMGWECSAVLLARVGAMALARGMVQGTHEGSACFRAYEAFDRWRRGDREGALHRFEGVFGLGTGLYRGELLLELGRSREAVEALRRYRRVVDFPWGELRYGPFTTATNYARSLYLEAVALERLGQHGEALATVRRFLRLWEHGDPDRPMLRDANALEKRLAARSR
jgi:tetratricopeptide (TPR) repeat protein